MQKPHTVAETLNKSCDLEMMKVVLSEETEKRISLSDNVIRRRIDDIFPDTRDQVVLDIKVSSAEISV